MAASISLWQVPPILPTQHRFVMISAMHKTRFLVVAMTALLTSSLAGQHHLVLCLGANGHRALEVEHRATGCPAGPRESQADSSLAEGGLPDCVDLASIDAGAAGTPSSDMAQVVVPSFVLVLLPPEATALGLLRTARATEARAGPIGVLAHLRSTVLLV